MSATDSPTDGTTNSFENRDVDKQLLMNNHEVREVSLIPRNEGSYGRTVGGSTGCGHWCQRRNISPDKDSTITRTSINRILLNLREMELSYQKSDSESESDSESSDSQDSGNWSSDTEQRFPNI